MPRERRQAKLPAMPTPRAPEGTILAAVVADVWQAALALGINERELRAATGVEPAALADPDARVPVAWDVAVWMFLAQRPIGLALGERLGVNTIGVVGYAMQHRRTVGEALDWLQRFRAVLHPELLPEVTVRETPAGSRLVFANTITGAFAALREPVYAYASGIRALLRGLSGRPVATRSVTYPMPRPADPSPHEEWFRCPVAWGGGRFEIAFDAEVRDWPLPRNDPRLFAYLAQQVERLDAAVPDDDTAATAVRREVAALLHEGEPRQGRVARRVAMSARTMQRRLAAEGTSFAAIVDAVRRERAELFLRDPHLTAGEVAFLLGYSEPAAFFRAFRRWTGRTPQQWRTAAR